MTRSKPLLITGFIVIILGGLLSAGLAPRPSYIGHWAVAYIVLVGGAAQFLLGYLQDIVTDNGVTKKMVITQTLLWNVSSAGVVLASVLVASALLYVATALQITALLVFLFVAKSSGAKPMRLQLVFMRLIILTLAVSAPIGLFLHHN